MDHLPGCRWNAFCNPVAQVPPPDARFDSLLRRTWRPSGEARNARHALHNLGYRTALRLGGALAALGLLSPRCSQGPAGQGRGCALTWARSSRDDTRPLVWFHAASVGEGLQADSVLRQLRRLRPDCQLIYTHFSPSAESLAARLPGHPFHSCPTICPMAWPVYCRAATRSARLRQAGPVAGLVTRASTTGTEVAIVAATVSPGSGRLRWPVRGLLRPGYRVVTAAGHFSR